MGLNRAELTTFCGYPYSTRTYFISRVNASKRTSETLDYSNEPFPPRQYRAHPCQHDYSLFFWQLLMCIDWREEIPHGLLHRGNIGECLIHTFGVTLFYSYRCLRSCFCNWRGAGSDETKAKGFCIPHTSPTTPLNSSHWWLLNNFPFPKCGVAGSPRRSGIWSNHRLFL